MEPKYPAPDPPGVWQNLTVLKEDPRLYARVKIDKNSRGYTTESSVSVEGVMEHEEMHDHMIRLLRDVDEIVRAEVARRESVDEAYRSGPIGKFEVDRGEE